MATKHRVKTVEAEITKTLKALKVASLSEVRALKAQLESLRERLRRLKNVA